MLYAHANYNQGGCNLVRCRETVYVGAPCDTAGYRLSLDTYWRSNVSSLGRGDASCRKARVNNQAGTSASIFNLPAANLGAYNDNVSYMQIYY